MGPEVLVTRPAQQAADLCAALAHHGVPAIAVPTVAIDRAAAHADVDEMLASRLDDAAWLVVTSANGAMALVERMAATGRRIPAGVRVAAVGPATARALTEGGIGVDHVPAEYRTTAIAEGLGDVAGRRVVLARADAATADLREALLARGADVVDVIAYRTIEGPADSRDRLRAALQHDLAGVAFTSSSAVRGLLRLASPIDRSRARAVPAFCVGPVTAETARTFGFDVEVVATEYTADGLASSIAQHLNEDQR